MLKLVISQDAINQTSGIYVVWEKNISFLVYYWFLIISSLVYPNCALK
jgi:hypothetical protein